MRKIEPDQFFTLAGVTRAAVRTYSGRGEMCLAFGVNDQLAGGTFLDLDVIAWALSGELTPAFGRRIAASIIRQFSDEWCGAVAVADTADHIGDVKHPIWLVLVEQGGKLEGQRATYQGMNLGYGDAATLGGGLASATHIPQRITWVNLTSLLAGIRAKARAMGLDWSDPFIDLGDLAFIQARDEAKAWREENMDRIRPQP